MFIDAKRWDVRADLTENRGFAGVADFMRQDAPVSLPGGFTDKGS